MLFYFTATGNSLYVAKQFDQEPISIPQVINQENLVFEDETIGVVWPVYAGEPPKMVLNFLKKAQFKRVQIYFLNFIMLNFKMQLLRYVLYKLGKRSLVYVPFIPIYPCYKSFKIRCKVSINCTECFFKRIDVTF